MAVPWFRAPVEVAEAPLAVDTPLAPAGAAEAHLAVAAPLAGTPPVLLVWQ